MEIPNYIKSQLNILTYNQWVYKQETGSTNEDAILWAKAGATDWALIIADAQTNGKGRNNRKWITTPGNSLAFSVVIIPKTHEYGYIGRFTALASLALIKHIQEFYKLSPTIKYPNDILLEDKKFAGVLVETQWESSKPLYSILGVGINVNKGSVPEGLNLHFPATCMEDSVGFQVNRWDLLVNYLKELHKARETITKKIFIQEWNEILAFKDRIIYVMGVKEQMQPVRLLEITEDGALKVLEIQSKEIKLIYSSELHIDPYL